MTDEEWTVLQAYVAASGLCLVAMTPTPARAATKFNPALHRRHFLPMVHAPSPIPRLVRDLPAMGLGLAKRRAWADIMDDD